MDGESDEDFGLEYSEDSNSEPYADLENQYYGSKSLKKSDPELAVASFKKVLELEMNEKSEWGFKALKQMIKLLFKLNKFAEMMESYKKMLTYTKQAVTRNHSEKAINSILDLISTSNNMTLLQNLYGATLEALKDSKNDRLWFKTNTKLGKLFLDQEEYNKLKKIIEQLKESCNMNIGDDDIMKGTQLLEIYALEIQMHTAQRNFKKLKPLYEKSLLCKVAIPHPFIMGVTRECGGKMHLREGDYEKAFVDFFQSFKSFDESGNARRITSLKYLILASMLLKSDINPLDSQEASPFKSHPEILPFTNLLTAFQMNDTKYFEEVLKHNRTTIMDDPFVEEHVEDLLRNIRTEAVVKLIQPYTRIRLSFISRELNVDETAVEDLLALCILDGMINGKIDQVNQILLIEKESSSADRYDAVEKLTNQICSLQNSIQRKMI